MSTLNITIASALILNADKDLLVVRKKNSKFYMLPGGKIELTEIPLQTLLRELKEELNLQFVNDDFEFLGQHKTEAANEVNTTVLGNIFLFRSCLKTLPAPQAELEEVRFISKSEYKNFQLAHLLQEFALPIWLKI